MHIMIINHNWHYYSVGGATEIQDIEKLTDYIVISTL